MSLLFCTFLKKSKRLATKCPDLAICNKDSILTSLMGKTGNKQRMTMELHCWKDEHERDNENLEDANYLKVP